MKYLRIITEFIRKLWNSAGSSFGDFKEIIVGLIMLQFTDVTVFGTDGLLNQIITIGMAILITYGVIKLIVNVLWLALFGKKFEWKVGLLEVFYKHLRVNRIVSMGSVENEESAIQAEQVIELIKNSREKIRQESGRWKKMMEKLSLFFKKFSVNKKTNSALIAVAAMFLTALDYLLLEFGITTTSLIATIAGNPDIFSELIAGEIVALSAVLSMGIKGKGFESEEEAKIRIENQSKVKTEAQKLAEAKKAELNKEKVAKKIIKTAEGFGAHPVNYAKNLQVLPEIIDVITKLISKK